MVLDTVFAENGLVSQVISRATAEFRSLGAELSVTGNFDRFQNVNRGGALTFGGYNPQVTNATRGVSVVVSLDGEDVATGAAALYETYERSMADVITEIGIYKSDEDRVVLTGECREWLESTSGRVMYIGGIWVKEEWKKTELSHTVVPLVPLITSTIATQVWQAQHMVSLVEWAIVAKGIADRYRVWFTKPGALWRLNGTDIPMFLCYTPPIQAVMDAKNFITQGMGALHKPLSRSASDGLTQDAA